MAERAAPEPKPGTPAPAQRSEAPATALAEAPPVQLLGDTARTLNARPALVAQRALAGRLSAPAQRAPDRNGLPSQLKAGIEALSGIAMDDVRVHRNSPKPAQLQAHAYAQGSDIHLAPGQDRHLPHEAWHVVQQKQGRVKPTLQMKAGLPVNDDAGLEREADHMGAKAMTGPVARAPVLATIPASGFAPLQGWFIFVGGNEFKFNKSRVEAEMDKLKRWGSSIGPMGAHRQAVLDKIQQWADSDNDEGAKGNSYEKLIENALGAVTRAQPKSVVPAMSSSSSRSKVDQRLVEQELKLDPKEKIEKLAVLRRQASLEAHELEAFRDNRYKQNLTHPDDPHVTYGIASGGSNFMLGGGLPDTYRELIAHIEIETGTHGADLARILLAGLRGQPIPTAHKGGVAKFVSLVHGPEFRRAAINPLSVQVALEDIARDGGDVFTALHDKVLFFATEPKDKKNQGLGGSKQSQYHREIVGRDDHFTLTASNEHDAFVRAAARAGYDVTKPDQMKLFITQMTHDHVMAHNVIYQGAVRPVVPAKKAQWTNKQLFTVLAVVSFLVVVLSGMMML